ELARRLRELVVERWQDLLLDLLHRRRHGAHRVVGELERDLLRLARGDADEALLDLLDEAAGADLDDVVALRLPALGDEIDDDGVAVLHGAAVDRRELRDGRAERLELAVDELAG